MFLRSRRERAWLLWPCRSFRGRMRRWSCGHACRPALSPVSYSLFAATTSSCRRSPWPGPCGCAHWCACAGRGPAGHGDDAGRGSSQVHQPLDVHRHVAAEVTLDQVVAVDGLADLQDLGVGQLVDPALGRDADLLDDLGAPFGPMPWMYCSAMTTRLLVGILTPAIRATSDLLMRPARRPRPVQPAGPEAHKCRHRRSPAQSYAEPQSSTHSETGAVIVNASARSVNRPRPIFQRFASCEAALDRRGHLVDRGHAVDDRSALAR